MTNRSRKLAYDSSLSPSPPGVKAGSRPDSPPLAGPLPGPGPLLVAVSGGGDSVALLHILHQLAPRRGWLLVVGHVDHGLRPDSEEDARFVRELARSLDLACRVQRVQARRPGLSPEEAARLARRRALAEMAGQAGARVIALAHTADDQAETVLARVLCGTGPTGLAGMRTFSPPFWRPLLQARRGELREYLESRGLDWREDPSNREMGPLRNRIRQGLLPLARELVNPRAEEALCRLARLCADEEDYWQGWCDRTLESRCRREGTSLCLELDHLQGLEPAPRRRLLRAALQELSGSGQGILRHHLEALEELARGPAGRRLVLPGGLEAWREGDSLRLDRESGEMDFGCRLDGPGWVYLPPLGRWLAVESSPEPRRLRARGPVVHLPAGRVRWPLFIRPPRPGERFHPLGAPGSKRLSRFFIDHKVPPWWRRRTVVVADREGLWWAAPWSLAERARKRGGESRWLCLRLVDTSHVPSYT